MTAPPELHPRHNHPSGEPLHWHAQPIERGRDWNDPDCLWWIVRHSHDDGGLYTESSTTCDGHHLHAAIDRTQQRCDDWNNGDGLDDDDDPWAAP